MIENALQKSEETFKGIFNNARDGILLADIETKKFIFGNAMISQMLGYGLDELMTMGVEDIHPVEKLPEVIDSFEKLVRQETALVVDIPVKRKNGSLFFADINSFLIELSGHTYIVGFFRDVTKRKRAEEELHRVLKELDQRVQDRTEELQQTVAQLQQEVTERQRAEKATRKSEAKLRKLTQRVLALQEKQRKQLSWELQEDLAQYITALKLELRRFEPKLPEGDEKLRQDYHQVLNKINVIVENLRRHALDLSPLVLADLGLTVGLKSMFENFCRINDLECDLNLDELNQFFNDLDQISIYRVFEEALENVFQHAAATKVTLATKIKEDELEFLVEDNGQGFDPAIAEANPGVGLSIMAERVRALGGTFKLESHIAVGTSILFTIPRAGK